MSESDAVNEQGPLEPGPNDPQALLILGEIRGAYGIKGWVKVESFTDPPENIIHYPGWLLKTRRSPEWRPVKVSNGRQHGKGVAVKLEGVDDRDAAAQLLGASIAVPRSVLPKLPAGSYYWSDLIGLEVETDSGFDLGRVESLFATGANDVLVVLGERERLIPFIQPDVIREIDIDAKRMVVAWDPDF